jgi:hypothetical protein
MPEPLTGVVDVDIRDSEPDWSPFEAPKVSDGAASVIYIVLDDGGFSALSCYGGPIETPNGDVKVGEGRIRTQPGKFGGAGEGPLRRTRRRRRRDRRLRHQPRCAVHRGQHHGRHVHAGMSRPVLPCLYRS